MAGKTDIASASWSRSLATLAEDELAKRRAFAPSAVRVQLLAFDFAGVHHSDIVTPVGGVGYCAACRTALRPTAAGGHLALAVPLRASFAPIIHSG